MHFLILLLLCAPLFAQPFPPDSVWTFHYDNGGDEYFYDAIEVEDGYLLCGESREWNAQAGVALLVKIDFDGQLVWERTYEHERFRRCNTFLADSTFTHVYGEYVLESGQANGLFHTAINEDGDSIASYPLGFDDGRVHFWGGVGVDTAGFSTLRLTCIYSARDWDSRDYLFTEKEWGSWGIEMFGITSGAYINSVEDWDAAVGSIRRPDGSWDGVYCFFQDEPFAAIVSTFSDDFLNAGARRGPGDLVFVGQTRSLTNGTPDLWVVKDFNNILLWSHTYGGLSTEEGVEIVNSSGSGFIIAGNFSSEDINFEQSDFWLLKVDENGDSVWSVLAGGEESDHCEGMIETQAGYLLFGNSMSFTAPGWDGCAMFLGYVPDLAVSPSQLNFGPAQVGDSTLRTLSLINSGSNILTVSEVIGNAVYHPHFPQWAQIEVGDTFDVEIYFAPSANGNYIDTLEVRSDAISGTKYIRVLGAGIGGSAAHDTPLPLEFRLHSAYPNPFNNSTQFTLDLPHATRVTLSVFDIQGRLQSTLNNSELPAGSHLFTFDVLNHAAGLYFLRATSSEFTATKKLVLLK